MIERLLYPFKCVWYGIRAPWMPLSRLLGRRAEVKEWPTIVYKVGDMVHTDYDQARISALFYAKDIVSHALTDNETLVATEYSHTVQTGWGHGHGRKHSEAIGFEIVKIPQPTLPDPGRKEWRS